MTANTANHMEQYLSDLIDQAYGAGVMPEPLKNKMMVDLAVLFESRVARGLEASLSPEIFREFITLAEQQEYADADDAEDALLNFFEEKVPEYDAILQAAKDDFSAEYIANAAMQLDTK